MIFLDLAANIEYTLKLDAKQNNQRAYFLTKAHVLSDNVNVTLQEVCKDHPFLIEVSHVSHILWHEWIGTRESCTRPRQVEWEGYSL